MSFIHSFIFLSIQTFLHVFVRAYPCSCLIIQIMGCIRVEKCIDIQVGLAKRIGHGGLKPAPQGIAQSIFGGIRFEGTVLLHHDAQNLLAGQVDVPHHICQSLLGNCTGKENLNKFVKRAKDICCLNLCLLLLTLRMITKVWDCEAA